MTKEGAMKASTTARWLSDAIGQATKSCKFCVAGCLPVVDPGIEVDGLGAVKLPLKRALVKELVALCRVAPYGKGTQTLIVVLANPFEGGALVVRHGAAKQKLPFEQAASGKATCYAAFYADCEHEVERVNHGVRLCLAYNLVLKPKRANPSAAGKPAVPT